MKITLEFVGLFLFNRLDEQKRVTVAVIHADREDVIHAGRPLNRHKAFFKLRRDLEPSIEWPGAGNQYELTGNISFVAGGVINVQNWALPKLTSGCDGFELNESFFGVPLVNQTHAVIELRAGTFCSWRFAGPDGAINTRVTFDVPSFTMRDGGDRSIEFHEDAVIWFQNTELELAPTPDFSDWLWYYNATGNRCAPEPVPPGSAPGCNPPQVPKPFTLGCSNSQWP